MDDRTIRDYLSSVNTSSDEGSDDDNSSRNERKSSFRNFYDLDTKWKPIWGFGGLYSYDITDWLTVSVEYDILAMRTYIDHMVLLYLLSHF